MSLAAATVYSRQGCPYCVKIKQLFTQLEIQHVEYELNRDFTRKSFYEEFGEGSTFPQIVIGDQKVGGCTDTIKFLQENKIL